MGRSRAEIQRAYRERKKAQGGDFLEKDRKRKREAYVPVAKLSSKELKKRRQDVNARVKKHCQRKKLTQKAAVEDEQGPHSSTRKKVHPALVVKLPLPVRRRKKLGHVKPC